jgi:hypothetical protein
MTAVSLPELILSVGGAERRVAVDREITIGRDERNTIVLRHPAVSRRHCVVRHGAGALRVRDEGSDNGTFLDGARLVGEVAVTNGARLQIGPFAIVCAVPEGLAAVPPAPSVLIEAIDVGRANVASFRDAVRAARGTVLAIVGAMPTPVTDAERAAAARALRDTVSTGGGPGEVLRALNAALFAASKVATAVVVELDPRDGALRYATAGHHAPLVVRSDRYVDLAAEPSIELGRIERVAIAARQAHLAAREVALISSFAPAPLLARLGPAASFTESLRAAIAAGPAPADGALICLARA